MPGLRSSARAPRRGKRPEIPRGASEEAQKGLPGRTLASGAGHFGFAGYFPGKRPATAMKRPRLFRSRGRDPAPAARRLPPA